MSNKPNKLTISQLLYCFNRITVAIMQYKKQKIPILELREKKFQYRNLYNLTNESGRLFFQ